MYEELKETYRRDKKHCRLYRGLSLPPKAIEFYKEKQKDQYGFKFTAFTSASLDKGIAIGFAKNSASETGNTPVIFEIYIGSGRDWGMQYLNQDSLSAFPHEQEVLIG